MTKCQFHQDKVQFLRYVVSAQRIQIEDKRIEAVKNWPKPKSVRDIQVFLSFANFYPCFIQGFDKIAGPLTLMLRTTSPNQLSSVLLSLMVVEKDEVGGSGSNGIKFTITPTIISKKFVGMDYQISDRNIDAKRVTINARSFGYLTPDAKRAFNLLR